MKLRELRENPNNPSKCTEEQLERLAGKLKRVPLGLTAMRIAYVTDDKAGGKMVISGNKRLRVLKKAYGEDAELPDEYFQDVTAMSEAERHEFIVTANVNDGEWDLDKLLEQYDKNELKDLMGEKDTVQMFEYMRKEKMCNRYRDKDDVPKTEEKENKSVPGKVYQLGRHRLICGDSTKKETIDTLLKDKKADLVVTDPPYNVNIHGGTKDVLTIKNDNMSNDEFMKFMTDVWANIEYALKPAGVFYVWMADGGPDGEFEMSLRKTKLHQSMPIIWVKNSATFSMGRLDYDRRHEVCKYGWKPGGAHFFAGPINSSTLLQDDTPEFDKVTKDEAKQQLKSIYDNSSIFYEKRPQANRIHPTMKPVALITKQIENSSREGELVLDLFLGSGTTLIAAEDSGRTCYGVEFDPKYCDVIRKRYAEYTTGVGCDWERLTPEVNEEEQNDK